MLEILLGLTLLALALCKLFDKLTKLLKQFKISTSNKLLDSGKTIKAEISISSNDKQENRVCAGNTNSKFNDEHE